MPTKIWHLLPTELWHHIIRFLSASDRMSAAHAFQWLRACVLSSRFPVALTVHRRFRLHTFASLFSRVADVYFIGELCFHNLLVRPELADVAFPLQIHRVRFDKCKFQLYLNTGVRLIDIAGEVNYRNCEGIRRLVGTGRMQLTALSVIDADREISLENVQIDGPISLFYTRTPRMNWFNRISCTTFTCNGYRSTRYYFENEHEVLFANAFLVTVDGIVIYDQHKHINDATFVGPDKLPHYTGRYLHWRDGINEFEWGKLKNV